MSELRDGYGVEPIFIERHVSDARYGDRVYIATWMDEAHRAEYRSMSEEPYAPFVDGCARHNYGLRVEIKYMGCLHLLDYCVRSLSKLPD